MSSSTAAGAAAAAAADKVQVIDLLSDDDDDDDDDMVGTRTTGVHTDNRKSDDDNNCGMMISLEDADHNSKTSTDAEDNKDDKNIEEEKKPRAKRKMEDDTTIVTASTTTATTPAAQGAPPLKKKRATRNLGTNRRRSRNLQVGLVLEEDILAAIHRNNYRGNVDDGGDGDDKNNNNDDNDEPSWTVFLREQEDRIRRGQRPHLFEDPDFGPVSSSIQGVHQKSILTLLVAENGNNTNKNIAKMNRDIRAEYLTKLYPKCRCGRPCQLSYKQQQVYANASVNAAQQQQQQRAFFQCANTGRNNKCQWFSWAFSAELMPWYRYGRHNHHVLVVDAGRSSSSNKNSNNFSAQDLVQGKVGDCWFLSALAVVAERPDLIRRLFQRNNHHVGGGGNGSSGSARSATTDDWNQDDQLGMVHVNLFVDGWWTRIVMDNFLPCMVGQNQHRKEEDHVNRAIEASLKEPKDRSGGVTNGIRNPYVKPTPPRNPLTTLGQGRRLHDGEVVDASSSSFEDPNAMSNKNVQGMKAVCDYLDEDHKSRFGINCSSSITTCKELLLDRPAESEDLAYSKTRRHQLWVPFLEKAYAKSHGSYKAISGGHVAEAFLDLTGAPTLQIQWHRNNSHLNSHIMEPKPLWRKLLQWRAQRLPMGCGTDSSAVGIIGGHAYSILDVREIGNVCVEFFQEQLVRGTLGNVSGFTEYDGKVRLLRIRNPHGKGEWKGAFSDKSSIWEKLLASSGVTLPRTNYDDGTFWIGYDDFLMAFSNIDVVLAFEGNHAKSFVSNFPQKKSNHRCVRAFEVSLIDPQPGIETKDQVEVYVMGIQKNRRGARQGRSDRMKSYKVSDFGVLVGEYPLGFDEDDHDDEKSTADTQQIQFSTVHGQMFGFRRNGHYRLLLDRSRCRRMVVMPISFGHPAATDKELTYVVRFNADSPLMIRELHEVPRMDHVLQDFLFGSKPTNHFLETRQGQKKVLLEMRDYRIVQINCLGNHGGTAFVYLCANDQNHRSRKEREPISLALEATCRGMSCRVDGKLLDHETVAKGKKFEAAWRRYRAEVFGQSASRLLMVLYQSGQDTEMGSITCEIAQSQSCGGGSGGAAVARASSQSNLKMTTLDQHWKINGNEKAARASMDLDSSYAEKGIFHPVPMHAALFRDSGSCEMLIDEGLGVGMARHIDTGGIDADLQKALEISRRDDELERALKASLEGQRVDAGGVGTGSGSHGVADTFATHDPLGIEDADMQEALKRSCQVSGMPSGSDVVVLDHDDDGDEDDDLNLSPKAPTSSVNVNAKPCLHKKIPPAGDILDLTGSGESDEDDDGEKQVVFEEEKKEDDHAALDPLAQESPDDEASSFMMLEHKRSKLAVAALKRLEKQSK